ncbi:ammonium transporter [Vibrio sp. Isolate25]|uniref:ammonium transporter n=1 Tax=Vibrio sp. Isolate25 TaxID=2908535 RepID=UPI001EFD3ADC|nr:ammonium transporter [Vibrio sp. Isolate25]MCG9596142.1 ammonium transporter [Vibrio sp. Isolate25]
MNSLFVFLCTLLVLLMQVGFLLLEAGTVRRKNTVNVAAKNLIDLAVVLGLYWLLGYGIMFGDSWQGLLGTSQFMLPAFNTVDEGAFFFYQMVFCATSVTIISGAIAERGSLKGYIAISVLIATFIYPTVGHWIWADDGWLAQYGFVDFAGSTAVHAVGGWAALAAVIVIGPRLDRFKDGKTFHHSSLVQTVTGVVFLWIGWLGFNAGSSLAFSANTFNIILNTILAGAMGGLTSALVSLYLVKRVHVPHFCNGILSGLVAITANCHLVNAPSAVVIGMVAAVIYTFAHHFLIRKKIDDVVGAIPVHLANGIWGTLAVAFFAPQDAFSGLLVAEDRLSQIVIQIFGISVTSAFVFPLSYLAFYLINKLIPLRVPQDEEVVGLNISSHEASSELYDLVTVMQHQEASGDFTQRISYDPTSEVGMIARQYNRVLTRFEDALVKVTKKHHSLVESNQRIKEMEARLERDEKLSNLGQVSSGLLREINGPISYVLSNINTLKDYNRFFKTLVTEYKTFAAAASAHPIVAKEVLNRIDRICAEEDLDFVFEDSDELIKATSEGALKIDNILSNIKTFSDYSDEPFDLKDVHVILSSAIESLSERIESNCQIIESYGAENALVSCSSHQLEQLFVNLLVNSLQAIGNELGAIKVITSNSEKELVIHIVDSGIGIPEENISQIFEPFFSTRAETSNTGLGLSICHGVVNNHGGKIDVVSKVGKGTKFTVHLPISN